MFLRGGCKLPYREFKRVTYFMGWGHPPFSPSSLFRLSLFRIPIPVVLLNANSVGMYYGDRGRPRPSGHSRHFGGMGVRGRQPQTVANPAINRQQSASDTELTHERTPITAKARKAALDGVRGHSRAMTRPDGSARSYARSSPVSVQARQRRPC